MCALALVSKHVGRHITSLVKSTTSFVYASTRQAQKDQEQEDHGELDCHRRTCQDGQVDLCVYALQRPSTRRRNKLGPGQVVRRAWLRTLLGAQQLWRRMRPHNALASRRARSCSNVAESCKSTTKSFGVCFTTRRPLCSWRALRRHNRQSLGMRRPRMPPKTTRKQTRPAKSRLHVARSWCWRVCFCVT